MNKPVSVLQEWVQRLTFMQQSVLITAMRGPDGIAKNHVAKLLLRWLRRCVLYSAFESKVNRRPTSIDDPWTLGGGSFTGQSVKFGDGWGGMREIANQYLSSLDEIPHHYQLHFMHAAEIVGYKHPDVTIGEWWHWFYFRLANDMHLQPETFAQMEKRLGDFEADWRSAEEVTAEDPS